MSYSKGKSTVIYGGMGFFEVLGLILIVLKLCKVIDLSWWLVLLPIYGPIALYIAGLLIVLLIAVISGLIQGFKHKHQAKKMRSVTKAWFDSIDEE